MYSNSTLILLTEQNNLLKSIRESKFIITGGLGFIGSHVIDYLFDQGAAEILVIDNKIAGTDDRYIKKYVGTNLVKFINGDINDIETLLPNPGEYDAIIHLAAQPDVKVSVDDPVYDFTVNVTGSIKLLEFARQHDINDFLFTASGGTVYGEPNIEVFHEELPFRPISNYGAAKAAVEMYLSSYNSLYGLKTKSIRLGNVYGPRSTHGVLFDFYNKLIHNSNELKILGNGKQEKAYLYIDDCISGLSTVLLRDQNHFEYYNMAYPKTYTVDDLADIIIKRLYPDKNVVKKYTGGNRGWNGDVVYTNLDITKLRGIGWNPKIILEEGVNLYVDWLQH